ncbi:cell wall glucanase [Coniochaeta sp. 2T2.1]|nr:cell wall glucanase [Coniochaeta sp. 2T2.1]
MKAVIPIFLLASLLDTAASHPHPSRRRHHPQITHQHHKPHAPVITKRDTITVVVDSIPFTTQLTKVVVLVDSNGKPIQTATEVVVLVPPSTATYAQPYATPQAATSALSSSDPSTTPAGIVWTQAPPPSPGTTQSPTSTTAAAPYGSDPNGTEGGDAPGSAASRPGISYSPFNSDGSCKPARQIFSDIQDIAAMQYGLVRIYGVDCDQIAPVVSAAKSTKLKLFLGIYYLDNLQSQIQNVVNDVLTNSTWSLIETVSVGNELVNNGLATAQQVMAAVSATRQVLRGAGYTGPVVTVDTFVAVLRNPTLCDESDFCAMNIHPFFDANTPASQAGKFVYDQVNSVRNVLSDKNQRIVVTETGWPWQGCAHGLAVPGKQEQKVAIGGIKAAFEEGKHGDLILFSAFNDPWKKAEASTFFAEQYWGIDQF